MQTPTGESGPWYARVRGSGRVEVAPPPPCAEGVRVVRHVLAYVHRGRDGHACSPAPALPPAEVDAYVARVRVTSAYSTYPVPLRLACPPATEAVCVPVATWVPAADLPAWTHPVGAPAALAAKWTELQRARATLADDALAPHATPDAQWFALPAREPAARLLRLLLGDDALPAVHRDALRVLRTTVGEARAHLAAIQQRYFAPFRARTCLAGLRVGRTPELTDALAGLTAEEAADCVLCAAVEVELLVPDEDS